MSGYVSTGIATKQLMMEHYLYRTLFFSSGLILAALAGMARYYFIDKNYRTFIIYLWVGLINEGLSFYFGAIFGTTVINNSFFMLAEILLLNEHFRRRSLNGQHLSWYSGASLFFCVLFVVEVMMRGIDHNLIYFNVLYCFYLVMRATQRLAQLMAVPLRPFHKDPEFLICCAVLIYFSYRIIIEAFWFYGLQKSSFFRNEVYGILLWINLFVNLWYLYAILWIQKKPGYITFYG